MQQAAGAATDVTTTTQPATGDEEGSVAGAAQKKYVASVNSDLFHDHSCPSASRIKEENQVWFGSVEEAQAAGYSPSQCTRDRLGL